MSYAMMTREFESEVNQLIHLTHHNPHHFLGIHLDPDGGKVIRVWRPFAQELYLELFGEVTQMDKVHEAGLFICKVPPNTTLFDYRVYHQSGLLTYDPYAFWPTWGELDLFLFSKGVHYELYKAMGGRIAHHEGVQGVKFSVWAPSACGVSLVADFNYWNGRANPMRSMGGSGVWEIFVPGITEGEKYKFEIKTQGGEIRIKSDPYGLSSEFRPATASIISQYNRFSWNDEEWIKRRTKSSFYQEPLNIYEVHLGSWRKGEHGFLNYREIAKQLVIYCREMGFTHVELLPIQEHPLDESWGYQVSGFYAVTSRFGTPEDFQWFVNHLHQHQIGVILDWVPGHFPTDDFSLRRFDGTALYEHDDPRQGWHPHWSTLIFNFGRHEVSNFLIANALFWLEQMHVDGLRVDAVASMLYLDYGRKEGEWIPNRYGTKENIEAIEFFKHLNAIVHEKVPGCLMIAEESTCFTGVTHSLQHGGLGFDMKWNMGWMNDTLRYFSKDMIFRYYAHRDLTFGLLYAFSENFILPFSHDEVVHGKGSLLSKMPGDYWQKFANIRLLHSYRICQPGKKLLFMGGEVGQWNEWSCKREIEWDLLQFPVHSGLQTLVRDLNHFYLHCHCLWERDFHYSGFEWVDFSDTHNSVISYLRKGSHGQILCVHNFTPGYHLHYFIGLSNVKTIREIFNTDAEQYGGSGKLNHSPRVAHNGEGKAVGVEIQVAPLATMIFEVIH